ncbi:hypothetical protein G6F59_017661 [Rhizopus arrhizus]|nr:hypothetical protein G6F59_017661 [Rhizopus arrhizus]
MRATMYASTAIASTSRVRNHGSTARMPLWATAGESSASFSSVPSLRVTSTARHLGGMNAGSRSRGCLRCPGGGGGSRSCSFGMHDRNEVKCTCARDTGPGRSSSTSIKAVSARPRRAPGSSARTLGPPTSSSRSRSSGLPSRRLT